MKKRKILSYLFAVFVCATFFVLFSFVYLNGRINNAAVSGEKQDEPYYTGPSACGVLFCFPGGDCFLYLDFKNERIKAKICENANKTRVDDMPVNYTVNGDHLLLAGIIDRVGGAELEGEEGILRYTGVQTVELLAKYPFDITLKKDVVSAIFSGIAKNGFSKSDFVYIIENSSTDLPIVDCFRWQDLMAQLAADVEVIT